MAETDRIDALFGLPLDEFTLARDALAADLKKGGESEEATRVKKLKKPSLSAWAVNQVAQEDRDKIAHLFELRDRIEGSSDARDLRALSDERRHLIAELVKRAEAILKEAGRSASATTLQAITQTLHAGDTDEEREDLLHGRLSRDLEPGGFGGFSLGGFSAAPEEDEAPDPKLEQKRQRAEELATEADEAEAEAERADAAVAALELELKRARAVAVSARRSADQTRSHADRAQAELAKHSEN